MTPLLNHILNLNLKKIINLEKAVEDLKKVEFGKLVEDYDAIYKVHIRGIIYLRAMLTTSLYEKGSECLRGIIQDSKHFDDYLVICNKLRETNDYSVLKEGLILWGFLLGATNNFDENQRQVQIYNGLRRVFVDYLSSFHTSEARKTKIINGQLANVSFNSMVYGYKVIRKYHENPSEAIGIDLHQFAMETTLDLNGYQACDSALIVYREIVNSGSRTEENIVANLDEIRRIDWSDPR